MGRPRTAADHLDRILDNGRTVRDTILDFLRLGGYLEHAADLVGLDRNEIGRWRRDGGRIRQQVAKAAEQGQKLKLTRDEQALASFCSAIDTAIAEGTRNGLTLIDMLAQGGIPQTTITLREERQETEPGVYELVPVERTTKTTHTLPDGASLRWRAERRHPHHYGQHQRLEVTGAEGGPVELTTGEKREKVDAMLAGLAAKIAVGAADDEVVDAEVVEGE